MSEGLIYLALSWCDPSFTFTYQAFHQGSHASLKVLKSAEIYHIQIQGP